MKNAFGARMNFYHLENRKLVAKKLRKFKFSQVNNDMLKFITTKELIRIAKQMGYKTYGNKCIVKG